MTDELDHVRPAASLGSTLRIENNRTITVPVDQVVVVGERRQLNETKVEEMKKSFNSLGLLNPIVVAQGKGQDGREEYRLVAGLHRLEATKRLSIATIRCTVLECDETLRVELAEIDENLIRNDPSPAEHAKLTRRRAEIIKELVDEGKLSQSATASKQAQRRAGQKSGPDVASIRDQAKWTGESKDKIHRSTKRGKIGRILDMVRGTSLDKGVELDALAKLPEAEREDLAKRAARGEAVSARTADRKPKPKRQSKFPTRRQKAFMEFSSWAERYEDLEHLADVRQQITEITAALRRDPPDRTGQVTATKEETPLGTTVTSVSDQSENSEEVGTADRMNGRDGD
jgi:ParB/RepB/Spo0J family partition protein